LFFSAARPPPTSTLFPYTTLFRSFVRPPRPYRFHVLLNSLQQGFAASARLAQKLPAKIYSHCEIDLVCVDAFRLLFYNDCIDNQDRKSTRLNSSHVSISYAVFCLK